MPDPSMMMFSRPLNCEWCSDGYYALSHMVKDAAAKGSWTCIDMAESHATQEYIFPAISQYDPAYFFGFGHGSYTTFTGDTTQEIFSVNNCSNLAGRYVYLLSCLTANLLGPAIIDAGAKEYAGYNISWAWVPGTTTDPYDDNVSKCTWESANEFWHAFMDTGSFDAAYQASIDKYNWWINYWMKTEPENPNSLECIKELLHDRDGLVVIHAGEVVTPTQGGLELPAIIVWGTILTLLGGALWWMLAKPKPKRG